MAWWMTGLPFGGALIRAPFSRSSETRFYHSSIGFIRYSI